MSTILIELVIASVFVVDFTLVGKLGSGSEFPVAGYYYYYYLAQVTYNQVHPLRINYLASQFLQKLDKNKFLNSHSIKCDLLCQNPPLTHTMSMNSFHRQWIAPSIN